MDVRVSLCPHWGIWATPPSCLFQSLALVGPFRLELARCPIELGLILAVGKRPQYRAAWLEVGKEAIVHPASSEVALPPL